MSDLIKITTTDTSARIIADMAKYPEEVELLRGLGAHAVFHISDEAGSAFADDAMAAPVARRPWPYSP